jgi:4-diphosphocytidyl-2-C-methyl-D-erythritol kinase
MITEFAPAKLNLYLHITGRRPDGYHDLDSLVAFAGVGDEIRLEPAESFSFSIEGPQAAALAHETADDNLVVKAAKSLAELTGKKLNAKLVLVKHLPVASGIGGGSSDAAAALRALAKHWGLPLNDPHLHQAAARHGQDVPVCLKVENNYMTATGTDAGPPLPYADIVLVNPNKGLSTIEAYKTYANSQHDFSLHAQLKPEPKDLTTLITELKKRQNDLFEPACYLLPEIKTIIERLDKTGSLLSRMSGSGATCFGFYPDRASARKAAADILQLHPHWWVAQSYIPCRTDPRQDF